MHYEFRDTAYQGKIIRHIKAIGVDSHGRCIAPVTQLHVIRRVLERTHETLVVVVMTSQGRVLAVRSAFMQAFEQAHPCLYDASYQWQTANYRNPSLSQVG